MLTDDTLRKVRETARIDEVASGYLTLHRSGKDFVALCPFCLLYTSDAADE